MTSLLEVMLESKELKRTITARSIEYSIPFKYICQEVEVDYRAFMASYINTPGSSKLEITEDKFIKILKILGIDIRHQFIIDTSIDMSAVSKKLADKYEAIILNNRTRR